MTDQDKTEGRRTRPFADFFAEHNRGAEHIKASEALQELVTAVVDTGKKGSVTITVAVEPMKGTDASTMLTTITVVSKLPQQPIKSAVFYADDEGNLRREDPRQLTFDGLKTVDGPGEAKDVPVAPLRDTAGGAQ